MARPRKPVEVMESTRRIHRPTKEVEARKQAEQKVLTPSTPAKRKNIKVPDYLPEACHKEFKSLAKQLTNLDIFSNLDADTLASYLIAKHQYIDVTQRISRLDLLDPELSLGYVDLIGVQDKLFKQIRATASDLGLTISSRCKLVIPKPEVKPANKFDKFKK